MEAFLTGSQVYGTPTKDSDVDLVVLVNEDTLFELCKLGDQPSDPTGTDYAVRFGRLNLVALTSQREFDAWARATRELTARKPVTRAEAVEAVKRCLAEAADSED